MFSSSFWPRMFRSVPAVSMRLVGSVSPQLIAARYPSDVFEKWVVEKSWNVQPGAGRARRRDEHADREGRVVERHVQQLLDERLLGPLLGVAVGDGRGCTRRPRLNLSKYGWLTSVYRRLYAWVFRSLMSKYRPGNSRFCWWTTSPLNSSFEFSVRLMPRA